MLLLDTDTAALATAALTDHVALAAYLDATEETGGDRDMAATQAGGWLGAAEGRYHVRWMIRPDVAAALAADGATHPVAWDVEGDLLPVWRRRNVIGMVAVDVPAGHVEWSSDGDIRGFMVYELQQDHVRLLRLSATRGAARALVAKLKSKLSSHRRPSILVEAAELCEIDAAALLADGFTTDGTDLVFTVAE